MKQPVICLIAPTASGKTALAYELYDTGNYYLISVDSALIYRDMNIGTAKPTAAELTQYPHALVDIIDPTDHYSVAQFVTDVQTHINLAHARGKIPLLVGGTMMYYMALLEGINDIPATELAVRAQVAAMIAEQGIEKVHNFLTQIDPCLGAKFFPTDTQRIGRAVEVYLQTGKPLSQWQAQPNTALADNPDQQWHIVTIMPNRVWLHERIAQRLDTMWQQGLIAEVIALRQKYPLTADLPSMRCVGYRQTWDYLEKMQPLTPAFGINSTNTYINDTYTNDTCLNLNPKSPSQNHNHTKNRDIEREYRQTLQNEALYATRQLAKRQYTWLRKLTTSPTVAQRVDSLQTFLHIQDARPYLLTQPAFT